MWRQMHMPAPFWWRDDDAIQSSDQLTRMLDITSRYSAFLGLAVIPSLAKPELRNLLTPYPRVSVLQHGFAHINHASGSEKKSELGLHRDPEIILKALASGLSVINKFTTSLPVLVPPWNRIDSGLISKLAAIGYGGISTVNCRRSIYAAPGLISINTHVDIINWRGTREFIGTGPALDRVIKHLSKKRIANIDIGEPTGLLTHHLVHDDACWEFIENFLDCLGNHDGARLINIAEALTP